MPKRTHGKDALPEPEEAAKKVKTKKSNKKPAPVKSPSSVKNESGKAKNKESKINRKPSPAKSSSSVKAASAVPKKEATKKAVSKETKSGTSGAKSEGSKPGLRSVYSNSRYTLLPLGFATDFKTNASVIIFSNLATGEVHTIALSVWKRWKLKEVKTINTET